MPTVTASSFADPADVAAFRRCKAQGKSDKECFKVGDNGIGCWGDDTTRVDIPMCALPPEDWIAKWGHGDNARGRRVKVTYNRRTVIGELRDTMPERAHITNGAGIDLNPGFARAFGFEIPFLVHNVTWEWA